jgi:hypothetical protein
MSRPRSNRAYNLRSLKRAGDGLNSTMLHMFNIAQNYEAHKEYQIKYFQAPTEHTIAMINATEYIKEECLKLQNLIIAMAVDIDKN